MGGDDIGGRLSWVKAHVREELYGQGDSVHGRIKRELSPEQRWVWHGLKLMAGDSPVPGVICLAEGMPYEEWQIAQVLGVSEESLTATVDKLMEIGVISVNGSRSFEVVEWEHYHGRNKRTAYMRDYMREVYRPRKRAEKEEESKPNDKLANVNQANFNHVRRDETRRDNNDETRRENDERNERGVVDIHESHCGPIGHPPEALMNIFVEMQAYALEDIDAAYDAAITAKAQYPAGYALKVLKGWERDGPKGHKQKADESLDPDKYIKGKRGHLVKR